MGDCYCYDGTIAGLFTIYSALLRDGAEPDRISASPPEQQELFGSAINVLTDADAAEQFWGSIKQRLSADSMKMLRRCLLAEHPEQELLVFRYLLLEQKEGGRIDGMLAHPLVAPVWKLSRQVGREAHRYLGFVRFRQVKGGIYYSDISPDHRILLLIGAHFAKRFSDQHWIIHDRRHGEGILYDAQKGEWLLLPMELNEQPEPAPEEEGFQELWRRYFNTLAIPERKNLRLQQGKVPLKVRGCLTEFVIRTMSLQAPANILIS